MKSLVWMAGLLCACLLLPAPASAYKIAVTQNEAALELYWDSNVIPFTFHHRGAEDVHDLLLEGAFLRAFSSWGEVPSANVQFQRMHIYSEDVSEPNGDNVLFWTEYAWSHDPEVIALTSINYYPDTGQIVDVDIEFNGQDYRWSVFDEDVETDLQSIATHEIGHMIGLDHSSESEAVMDPYYLPGETRQRQLHEDDEAGVTYLYPCSSGACDDAFFEENTGCSIASTTHSGGWIIVGILAAALALGRRRSTWALGVVLGLVVVSWPQPELHANVTSFEAIEGVVSRSQGVVHGQVVSVEPFEDGNGRVHSMVEIDVHQWLRGAGPSRIQLHRPSGELPGLGTFVPGDPRFEPGLEVILCLSDRHDGTPGLLGMSLGYLWVEEVEGIPVIRRDPSGHGGADVGDSEYYPYRPLLNWLGQSVR